MECPETMSHVHEAFPPDCYNIEAIPAMNEIYVASSHHNNNSDTVFYTQHCDGPWSVYPFCHVYRVMLAVNENKQVETHFTMERSGGCLSGLAHRRGLRLQPRDPRHLRPAHQERRPPNHL